MSYIEYLINGIFSNSTKYYVTLKSNHNKILWHILVQLVENHAATYFLDHPLVTHNNDNKQICPRPCLIKILFKNGASQHGFYVPGVIFCVISIINMHLTELLYEHVI